MSYTVQEAEQANLDRINEQKDKKEVGGGRNERGIAWDGVESDPAANALSGCY